MHCYNIAIIDHGQTQFLYVGSCHLDLRKKTLYLFIITSPLSLFLINFSCDNFVIKVKIIS